MCGIFGTLNMDISEEKVNYCTDLLAHRGPDGKGIWKDSRVILGHRRLSILDLSDNGRQPMLHNSERYVITYNGEIYNYLEIRKELEAKGYQFYSSCDTEVVLNAFVEWGEKCCFKFNGMWAFAIWDRLEKKLFLCRDRFGVKPLYIYIKEQSPEVKLAFASEMKALLPIIEKPEYNREILLNKMRILTYEATENSVIKQIEKIKAGHYAWISSSRIEVTKWWNTCDHIIQTPNSYQEQVEQFRSIFISACKLRMRSDVTIGTALSGGLDSSATLSTMSYIMKKHKSMNIKNWQNAYSAVFPNLPLDEQKYAQQVARRSGAQISYIPVNAEDFLENLERDIYYFENIYITPPTPMMKVYGAMKANGVTVTLDGHGADELFCGYEKSISHAFADAKRDIWDIRSIAKTYMGLYAEKGQNLYHTERTWWMYYLKNKDIKRTFSAQERYCARQVGRSNQWKNLDNLNKELFYETHYQVLPTLLRNYDSYSMSNGVEIRMPFLDYRVVCFAFSVGWKSKIRGGYTKAIVRDALKNIMPVDIVYRKSKVGFSSPLLEWIRGPIKEFIIDTIESKNFSESSLTNRRLCEQKLHMILDNKSATQVDAEELWKEVNPYFWEKYFYKKLIS